MPKSVPFLHIVTDDDVLGDADFVERASVVGEAGGSDLALHLRGCRTTGRRLFELAERLLPVMKSAGGLLFLNDRCDVAVAAGADGAHLPERGIPPQLARRLLGPRRLLGRSVHQDSPVDRPASTVLDYLIVGPIHPTGSHPEREPGGYDAVRRFSELELPMVGIGGITPDRVGELRRSGVAGIGMLSGVWGAADPAAAVVAYRNAWSEAG
jgi:thiamine-phosphate diphosphorylase